MDSNIQCLIDKGILSPEQAAVVQQLSGVQGTSALLSIIAATLINDNSSFVSGKPLGVEAVSGVSSTNDYTLQNIPAGATRAVVTPWDNSIVFRSDGQATVHTGDGHFAAQGSNIIIKDLEDFHFRAASPAVQASLFVSYY